MEWSQDYEAGDELKGVSEGLLYSQLVHNRSEGGRGKPFWVHSGSEKAEIIHDRAGDLNESLARMPTPCASLV